jgi:Zn-dependent protease with chaperone function
MEISDQVPDGKVNITDRSPLMELVLLLSGVLAIVLSVYFLLGFLVDYSVQYLSPENEKALAEHFQSSWENHLEKDTAKVQNLLDNLQSDCAKLPYKTKAYVIDQKTINAGALPGGTLLVFSGLLDEMQSENELAFVLGHELGHFKNKDHLKGLGRGVVLLVLSNLLLGPNNALNDIIFASLNIASSKFSREQESEADEFALHSINCYYGHIGGATDFFSMMQKEYGDPKLLAEFLASHPYSSTRIQDIHHLAAKNGYSKKATIPLSTQNNASH